MARSAFEKPGSCLPSSRCRRSAGKTVCGAGLPMSVDGTSEGSPERSAIAKNPATTHEDQHRQQPQELRPAFAHAHHSRPLDDERRLTPRLSSASRSAACRRPSAISQSHQSGDHHCDGSVRNPDESGVRSEIHDRLLRRACAASRSRPATACARSAFTRRRRISLRIALRCIAKNSSVKPRPSPAAASACLDRRSR